MEERNTVIIGYEEEKLQDKTANADSCESSECNKDSSNVKLACSVMILLWLANYSCAIGAVQDILHPTMLHNLIKILEW